MATLSEQIFSHAAGRRVRAGEIVVVRPDVVMGHDSLSAGMIRILQEDLEQQSVFDPNQIVFVIDHVVPAATTTIAEQQNIIREFAAQQGIRLLDSGNGICHQILVEEGFAQPGQIVVGADSHSTTYGAVGAFGTGMGSSDVAMIFATGQTWMRVPETIRINVRGRFNPGVGAKDLALKICSELTISGANYFAIEYHGLGGLSLEERMTISSMAVEVGAKAGIFPPFGEAMRTYDIPEWLYLEDETEYVNTIEIDLFLLQPQVSLPHAVDQVTELENLIGQPLNRIFLGTCTNGRSDDIRAAANVLNGKKIAEGVQFIVTPASRKEMLKCIQDGSLAVLLEAGAIVNPPGCGPCLGRHQGVLAAGDICLSTGNRNFRGRMGSPDAQIYLVSPAAAAASALNGVISLPEQNGV